MDLAQAAPMPRVRKSRGLGLRRVPIVSVSFIVLIIMVSVFADAIAPAPYYKQVTADRLTPPYFFGGDLQYLLGTDVLGRDILSRLIYGGQIFLIVTLSGLFLSGIVGVALGMVSAFCGGWVDSLIMRVCDVMLSFPAVLIALLFAVIRGPSMVNVIIIVTMVLWGRFARLVRGEALSLRERDFIAYPRVIGTPAILIMLRHIFPNLLPSVLVLGSYLAGWVITMEASLSFLGAGVPPPQPSWGAMVSDGKDVISSAWWISTFPGLTIVFTCLALNQIGDWIRDALDPTLRQI